MLQTSKPKYSGVSASLTWTTLVPSGDQGRGVAKVGHKWGNFGLCCCGWQTVGSAPDEKSSYDVANKRDGWYYGAVFEIKKEIPVYQAHQRHARASFSALLVLLPGGHIRTLA